MNKGNSKLNAFLVPVLAVILGMIVGALIMLAMGYNPIQAYSLMFQGIFANPYYMGETLRAVTPLIFAGLAVAFAFRTGLFNIGVEGQFIVGQLAAAWVGISWDLPPVLHAITAVLVAMIAAGLYAGFAGWLKARLGVHEVITTIMLNYIALFSANYIIRNFLKGASEGTKDILPSASIASPFLSNLFEGARINWGLFIALGLTLLMYWLLWKTTTGYELRAVGFNPHASEYAGMNVSKNIVLSMVISGMLAGAGGAVETLGVYGYMVISAGFTGIGFDGIAVALIGANNPFGVVLGALLFGGFSFGADNMQRAEGIPTESIQIVISMVIYFVAASAIIYRLLGVFRRRREEVQS
ncbi:branched-chain amino acid ABC transporter permease [Tumebacillus algifaecis]|uniref:Branched-chain amino acid ABC transporter permease n=1 Tax=Tumebacillus algifaecis TaxID=1214604 RepID=A0A223D2C1_9BACL|nr:ABC transporter permease [Tumebacillus algifaecis]ASS75583.1 branched-chain amino acid ABC transporter permease [Tumebacillus algifaecis]